MSTNEVGYIYIGAREDTTDLAIPYPTAGEVSFTTETNTLVETNANGEDIGQQIGEMRIIQDIGWTLIPAGDWWAIGQFFETNGDVFYCRFFNHNLGAWQTKKFWKQGETSAVPVLITDDTGAPEYYSASFSIKSVGD